VNKKITIAIDGFSSTGKSTLAKQIAKTYLCICRWEQCIVQLLLFRDKMDTSPDFFDKETLVHSLPFITLEFKFNAAVGFARNVNDVNVEKEIRTIKVSGLVK
jgi:cytidylate kinase